MEDFKENSAKLTNKLKLIYFLYLNKNRDYTISEMSEALEEHFSSSVIKSLIRQLRRENLLVPFSRRYCSITQRDALTYSVKHLPKPIKLLFSANGLVK